SEPTPHDHDSRRSSGEGLPDERLESSRVHRLGIGIGRWRPHAIGATVMRCLVLVVVACSLSVTPAFGQLAVIDPANLYQAVVIAERTLSEYNTLVQQYETVLKLAAALGPMDRYRTPPIAGTSHDPSRWPYAAPWLQGLNSGDARGTAYEQTARRLE